MRVYLIPLLIGVCMTETVSAQNTDNFLPKVPAGTQWKMTFNDEFTGSKLDLSKWGYYGNGNSRRKEGRVKNENVTLDNNGHLQLWMNKEADGTCTSGMINTEDKFEQGFGFFIVRCKLQKQSGLGFHPAFWLHSRSVKQVGNGGRDGTEIDIMENFVQDRSHHALHWDGYDKDHDGKSKKRIPMKGGQDEWHTHAVHWTPEEYVFYVDGKETWRTSAGGVSQVAEFVQLTTEFNTFHHKFIHKATFPQVFTVDYVRVFQLVSKKDGSHVYKPGPVTWKQEQPSLDPAVVLAGSQEKSVTGTRSTVTMNYKKLGDEILSHAWDIKAKKQEKANKCRITVKFLKPLEKGKTYVFSYFCKTAGDTRKGCICSLIQTSSAPRATYVREKVNVGPRWKKVEFRFKPARTIDPSKVKVRFYLGLIDQHLMLGDILVKEAE